MCVYMCIHAYIYTYTHIYILANIYIYCLYIYVCIYISQGFPGGSDGKESACNLGHPASIPGLERSPGEGNGYPL